MNSGSKLAAARLLNSRKIKKKQDRMLQSPAVDVCILNKECQSERCSTTNEYEISETNLNTIVSQPTVRSVPECSEVSDSYHCGLEHIMVINEGLGEVGKNGNEKKQSVVKVTNRKDDIGGDWICRTRTGAATTAVLLPRSVKSAVTSGTSKPENIVKSRPKSAGSAATSKASRLYQATASSLHKGSVMPYAIKSRAEDVQEVKLPAIGLKCEPQNDIWAVHQINKKRPVSAGATSAPPRVTQEHATKSALKQAGNSSGVDCGHIETGYVHYNHEKHETVGIETRLKGVSANGAASDLIPNNKDAGSPSNGVHHSDNKDEIVTEKVYTDVNLMNDALCTRNRRHSNPPSGCEPKKLVESVLPKQQNPLRDSALDLVLFLNDKIGVEKVMQNDMGGEVPVKGVNKKAKVRRMKSANVGDIEGHSSSTQELLSGRKIQTETRKNSHFVHERPMNAALDVQRPYTSEATRNSTSREGSYKRGGSAKVHIAECMQASALPTLSNDEWLKSIMSMRKSQNGKLTDSFSLPNSEIDDNEEKIKLKNLVRDQQTVAKHNGIQQTSMKPRPIAKNGRRDFPKHVVVVSTNSASNRYSPVKFSSDSTVKPKDNELVEHGDDGLVPRKAKKMKKKRRSRKLKRDSSSDMEEQVREPSDLKECTHVLNDSVTDMDSIASSTNDHRTEVVEKEQILEPGVNLSDSLNESGIAIPRAVTTDLDCAIVYDYSKRIEKESTPVSSPVKSPVRAPKRGVELDSSTRLQSQMAELRRTLLAYDEKLLKEKSAEVANVDYSQSPSRSKLQVASSDTETSNTGENWDVSRCSVESEDSIAAKWDQLMTKTQDASVVNSNSCSAPVAFLVQSRGVLKDYSPARNLMERSKLQKSMKIDQRFDSYSIGEEDCSRTASPSAPVPEQNSAIQPKQRDSSSPLRTPKMQPTISPAKQAKCQTSFFDETSTADKGRHKMNDAKYVICMNVGLRSVSVFCYYLLT